MNNVNFPIVFIEETDSTNTLLKEKNSEEEVPQFYTIRTAFQTSGRGQRGNGWESEKGKNLLSSTIIYPHDIAPNKQFIISQIVALSVMDVLGKYKDGFQIKWPNDIYYKEKKICGILIENTLKNNQIEYSIIGLGININQIKFSQGLPNPISLSQITGQTHNIDELLNAILKNIASQSFNLNNEAIDKINAKYRSMLFHGKGYHLYADADSIFSARIIDIESSGILVLQRIDGTISKYFFKEVKFLFDDSALHTF